jgi:hypothetical protein
MQGGTDDNPLDLGTPCAPPDRLRGRGGPDGNHDDRGERCHDEPGGCRRPHHSVGAATTGCAAKAVAQRDATTYSSLAPKALIGVASHNIQGQHASGWTNWPGRRDALATQRYNGSAIGYIFVSYTVRARTWETVVPAASTNGIAKSPPSDHNMIMTWAHV